MLDLSMGNWDEEKERAYQEWIAGNPSGLVLNLESDSGLLGSLHSAQCKSMIYVEEEGPVNRSRRFCFESEIEFLNWLTAEKHSRSEVHEGCLQCRRFLK